MLASKINIFPTILSTASTLGSGLAESNFKAIGQEPKFLKLFVFKGDVQVVYYLPKKMKEGGPMRWECSWYQWHR